MFTRVLREGFGRLLHFVASKTNQRKLSLSAKCKLSPTKKKELATITTQLTSLNTVAEAYRQCVEHGSDSRLRALMVEPINYMTLAGKFYWMTAFTKNLVEEVHKRVTLKFLDFRFNKASMDAKTKIVKAGRANRLKKLMELGCCETSAVEAWDAVSHVHWPVLQITLVCLVMESILLSNQFKDKSLSTILFIWPECHNPYMGAQS